MKNIVIKVICTVLLLSGFFLGRKAFASVQEVDIKNRNQNGPVMASDDCKTITIITKNPNKKYVEITQTIYNNSEPKGPNSLKFEQKTIGKRLNTKLHFQHSRFSIKNWKYHWVYKGYIYP